MMVVGDASVAMESPLRLHHPAARQHSGMSLCNMCGSASQTPASKMVE
jgi:hypothetical protein